MIANLIEELFLEYESSNEDYAANNIDTLYRLVQHELSEVDIL